MKVYFSSSLRAKKLYHKNFEAIYQIIKKLGYGNTSDFVLKTNASSYYDRKGEDFVNMYKNLTTQIKKADVCLFEVTLHSLGIGYCVDLALQMGKPVILLYQKGANPIFFKGIKSDRLQLYEYTKEDLKEVVKHALEAAKDNIDIRFTFFITPKINQFLDFIAKKKKVPRAVYIRNLLEKAILQEKFS